MFNLKSKKLKKKLLSTFNFRHSARSGFTLLELSLSLAIIALISGFSIPIYQSFQLRNDLEVASYSVTQTLRRAQTLSLAGSGDSSWGVSVTGGNVILFKGASFATRDINFDEVFGIPSVTASDLQEIVFDKFTGYPQTIGTTTLTSTTNETRQITINEKGTISF